MHLIPKPNGDVRQSDGGWTVKPRLTVAYGGFNQECTAAFSQRSGAACVPSETGADIVLVQEPAFAAEEYELKITPQNVTVAASSESGIILALTTLYLTITGNAAPCFTLRDFPRYDYRGFMLDSARHFFTVNEVKKIIEQISLAKINKLHWHLTDDQGWRVESKACPALHEGIPFYTRDEIRDIVRYAKGRNVEVIPEVDMPGHMSSAVYSYPWLGCSGQQIKRPTGGGIFKSILCAGKDSTYDFIFKILDEVTELFDSPYVHLGGDEAPKIAWQSCPACKAKLEAEGLDNFEELQGYFILRAAGHLKAKGKKVICWNDTLKSAKQPDNLTVQYWMPRITDGQTADFIAAGNQVVYSDMFHVYLDYPHAMEPMKRVYEYAPGAAGLGLEACLWTERVETEEKLEQMAFPRIFALAEAAWTEDKNYEDFRARLEKWLERLDENGVRYTSVQDADPDIEAVKIALMETYAAFTAAAEPDDNKVNPAEVFGSGDETETAGAFLTGFGIDPSILNLKKA